MKSKTLYQLTDFEFQKYLLTKMPVQRRSAKVQREFEQIALRFGYEFPESYQYKGKTTRVYLLCTKCRHIMLKLPRTMYENQECLICDSNKREERSKSKSKSAITLESLVCSSGNKKLSRALRDINK